MDILAFIALAAKLGAIAVQVGQDVMPFLKKIQDAASGDNQPTEKDFDDLKALEEPLRSALFDQSEDDPEAPNTNEGI